MSEDKVHCIRCGLLTDFEDAYVLSHDVGEDGYELIENCICKWCKELEE